MPLGGGAFVKNFIYVAGNLQQAFLWLVFREAIAQQREGGNEPFGSGETV
ncbi:hypothetical protein DSM107010_71010 [Chroococcidiopsis cubana SAG 39.79]|uniref:Uncharacterized protein n=1 Tax=Chroococcidiopsis cubana SAG 39.79 TaxID=388085 RepID=A0AB37U9D4_9CYAN|nr:hypothetical protein DSM107010_71010 [Chroococcidiopsis cubana SAG 39.79]